MPHHLLGIVDPTHGAAKTADGSTHGVATTVGTAGGDSDGDRAGGAMTVRDFRDLALPVVEDIRARGRVPLLVGGSDYYLRALVSLSLLDDFHHERAGVAGGSGQGGGGGGGDNGGGGSVSPLVFHAVGEDDADGDEGDDGDEGGAEGDKPRVQRCRRDAPTAPTAPAMAGKHHVAAAAGVAAVATACHWTMAASSELHSQSGAAAAHARLRAVDPASAAKLHPHNTRRVALPRPYTPGPKP